MARKGECRSLGYVVDDQSPVGAEDCSPLVLVLPYVLIFVIAKVRERTKQDFSTKKRLSPFAFGEVLVQVSAAHSGAPPSYARGYGCPLPGTSGVYFRDFEN